MASPAGGLLLPGPPPLAPLRYCRWGPQPCLHSMCTTPPLPACLPDSACTCLPPPLSLSCVTWRWSVRVASLSATSTSFRA